MGCHRYGHIDSRREWRLGYQDSGRQREYRKRDEGRKAERQRFLQRRPRPVHFISFHKILQTGPETFDIPGKFTIRGVTKDETLNLTGTGKATGNGEITGTMAFEDRKDYGMNSGIPFIKIADRVEVTVYLIADRVSGPPLVFKQ